jgi:hypothetical protein
MPTLARSDLASFRQCLRKLWLEHHHPDLIPQSDASIWRRANDGNIVAARHASYWARVRSARSVRSGFVAKAGTQNISLGETITMTDHRGVQTVMGYYLSGELPTSRTARMMDEPI